MPWSEVVERGALANQGAAPKSHGHLTPQGYTRPGGSRAGDLEGSNILGWLPSCACNPLPAAPLSVSEARKLTRPALVLDPFGGTGVTARTARALGRSAVSIDPILDYCQMAHDNAGRGCVEALAKRGRTLKGWAKGDDAQMGLFADSAEDCGSPADLDGAG